MRKFLKKMAAVALMALACVPFGSVKEAKAETEICEHKHQKEIPVYMYTTYSAHEACNGTMCYVTSNHHIVYIYCDDCQKTLDSYYTVQTIHRP